MIDNPDQLKPSFGDYEELLQSIADAKRRLNCGEARILMMVDWKFRRALEEVQWAEFPSLAPKALALMESALARQKQAIIDEAARLAAE